MPKAFGWSDVSAKIREVTYIMDSMLYVSEIHGRRKDEGIVDVLIEI